jgi:hypothetical protein
MRLRKPIASRKHRGFSVRDMLMIIILLCVLVFFTWHKEFVLKKDAKIIGAKHKASIITESTLNMLLDKLDFQSFEKKISSDHQYSKGRSHFIVDLWGSLWRIRINSTLFSLSHSAEYLCGQSVPKEYNYSFVALNQAELLHISDET